MPLAKLSLAASILLASGIAATAVEMIRPFEALEETRRAMIALGHRQTREKAEQQKQQKERETQRKHEEAEQRKRAREEKAQQQAQRKLDAAAAKAAQGAHPPSTSLPPQASPAPALAHEPSAQPSTADQVSRQAGEHQPVVQNAPPARPQVNAQPPTARPPTARTSGQADEDRPQARSGPVEPKVGPNQGQGETQKHVRSGGPSPAGANVTSNDTAVAAAPPGGHAIAASRLKRMNLYNERGDKLGDVKQVVQSPDGNFHIVIGAGGFLGIRERDVRIPLEGVTVRGSRLVIQGLTADQVRTMPVFDRSDRTYSDLTRNTTVLITRDQSEN